MMVYSFIKYVPPGSQLVSGKVQILVSQYDEHAVIKDYTVCMWKLICFATIVKYCKCGIDIYCPVYQGLDL